MSSNVHVVTIQECLGASRLYEQLQSAVTISKKSLLPVNFGVQMSMSSEPVGWKLAELLRRGGITDRAFRQMRSAGAVGPPMGSDRLARYSSVHLAQIQRVLYVEKNRGLSRSAACEFVGYETTSSRRSSAVQSRNRAAAELGFRGNVRRLTPEVFLVYSKQLPSFEKNLIDELTNRFRSQLKSRLAATVVSATVKSTIHRANQKANGR